MKVGLSKSKEKEKKEKGGKKEATYAKFEHTLGTCLDTVLGRWTRLVHPMRRERDRDRDREVREYSPSFFGESALLFGT